MIALFAALLLLIAGFLVFERRRHTRLKTACVAAFETAYADTSPRPGFEMGYSYGEPVFRVAFESRAASQASAAANAAFLVAIDDLCKTRGRKRQFKAQRAVFFQHPQEDEGPVRHCCDAMRAQVGKAVAHEPVQRAYGLKTSIVGTPVVPISHCPWCGSALPPA